MGWQQILSGNEDLEMTLPDGSKLKLSDLRSGLQEVNKGLIEKQAGEYQKRLAAERAQVDADRAAVTEMYRKVMEAGGGEPAAPPRPVAPNTNGSPYDYAKDEYLGQFYNEFQEKAKAMEDVRAQIGQLAKVFQDTIQVYTQREVERQFSGAELPEGMDRDAVLRYAMDNRVLDRYGMPDVPTAISRITEPKRLEKMKQDAEKAGAERALKEAGMSHIVRPGGAGAPPPKPAQKFDFKRGDWKEAARNDASIWNPPTQ